MNATWIHHPFGPSEDSHRLLLGSAPKPTDRKALQALGITDVIDCTKRGRSAWISAAGRWPHRPSRLHCGMSNGYGAQTPETIACMADALRWGVDALEYQGNVLYVHCHSGRHRSASIVYGLLRAGGWTAQQARQALLDRQSVDPRYIADVEIALRLAGFVR